MMLNETHITDGGAAQREAREELAEIIKQQGVKPLTVEILTAMGAVWPDDESVDEFLQAREEQRRRAPRREMP
jgi:hypothetical protein